MFHTVPFLLGALLLVGLLAGAVATVVAQRRRAAVAWADAAAQLGLRYVPSGWIRGATLRGSVQGVSVSVDTFAAQQASTAMRDYRQHTRYRVRYPDLGLGLRMRRKGRLARFAPLFGAAAIASGDPEFDRLVGVKARDPERARALLSASRRQSIAALFTSYPRCRLSDTELRWSSAGVETRARRIVAAVQAFVAVTSDLATATARPPDASLPRPAPAPAGATVAAGAAAPANAVVDAAATPPDEPGAAALDTDAGAVCRDLFGADRLGFEIARHFDATYRGHRVRWAGVLRRVERYRTDRVFGAEPGSRAVVEVWELERDAYGKKSVQAFAQLPESAAAALRELLGQRVVLEGRLVDCTPYMRQLYIAAARIV